MTHTPEQIAALVAAAEGIISGQLSALPNLHYSVSGAELNALETALQPFRPDPDAAAIEVMARAYCDARGYCYRPNTFDDGMRAALAALREWEEK